MGKRKRSVKAPARLPVPTAAAKLQRGRVGGNVVEFDPARTAEKISVLEAAIEHAKRMQDWQALWDAADWLIEEQQAFVARGGRLMFERRVRILGAAEKRSQSCDR